MSAGLDGQRLHSSVKHSLVRTRGVDAYAIVLADGGWGGAFVGVIKAARPCVSGGTRTGVATAGQRAARSTVGARAGQAAVLVLTLRPYGEKEGQVCSISALLRAISNKHRQVCICMHMFCPVLAKKHLR